VVRNNRIDCTTTHTTSAVMLQATFGFLDSILIENNLLEGNGYNLILEWAGNGYGCAIQARNNRFRPLQYGTGYVSGGCGWLGWQDNYLDNPAQADHRGSVVAEGLPQQNSALTAPNNLQATVQLQNRVRLTWTDRTGTELGFRIERALSGGAYRAVLMTSQNTTACTDTGLAAESYTYRVAAFNKDGLSGYSNVASAQAQSSIPPPYTDYPSLFMIRYDPVGRAIDLQGIPESGTVRLYAIAGAMVRQVKTVSHTAEIRIAGLSGGIYFVEINGTAAGKVVVVP
jgi:hypothetical protein